MEARIEEVPSRCQAKRVKPRRMVWVGVCVIAAGCTPLGRVAPDAGDRGDPDAGRVADGGATDVGVDAGRTARDGGSIEMPDGGATDVGVDAGRTARDGGSVEMPDGGATDVGVDAGRTARDGGSVEMPDGGTPTVGFGIPPSSGIRVITFNTGTHDGLPHDEDGDAYTAELAAISDGQYGNGLAWRPAIEGATAFLAAVQPDLVAFQEVFHPALCDEVESIYHPGFVCEGYVQGAPTVAQQVLGAGYQVACHLGKPDKCLGVRTSFASIRGCSGPLCLDHLDGAPVPNCGSGSRIGRATLDLVSGGELTVVTVHGTSGSSPEDIQCREHQIEQVFTDLDGEPGARGAKNIILGDFNTDPGRLALLDNSADRWTDYVGPGKDFHFVTDVGFQADATYSGYLNIDHVVSDVFSGPCWVAGVTPQVSPVLQTIYFDHHPIVCDLVED